MKRFEQTNTSSGKSNKQSAEEAEGSPEEEEERVPTLRNVRNGLTKERAPTRVTLEIDVGEFGHFKFTEEYSRSQPSPPPKRLSSAPLRPRKARQRRENDFDSGSDQSHPHTPSRRTNRSTPHDSAYGTGESVGDKAAYMAGSSGSSRARHRARRRDSIPSSSAVDASNEEDGEDERPESISSKSLRMRSPQTNTKTEQVDNESVKLSNKTETLEDEPDEQLGEIMLRVKNKQGRSPVVKAIVDTGTDRNWISDEFRRELGIDRIEFTEKEKELSWTPLSGPAFKALGKVELEMMSERFTGFTVQKIFYIIKSTKFSLIIGRNTISKEHLLWTMEPVPEGDDALVTIHSTQKPAEKAQIVKAKKDQEIAAAKLADRRQNASTSKSKKEHADVEVKKRPSSVATSSTSRHSANFAAPVKKSEKRDAAPSSSSSSSAKKVPAQAAKPPPVAASSKVTTPIPGCEKHSRIPRPASLGSNQKRREESCR